ncbi:MAG TPA: ARMT1-like domain-containing protein, partial [Syntrophorhabdaceae bacterium]|nr:ARMT1-like domain-containing protein [Syntrophorhabdaceae bacterium]
DNNGRRVYYAVRANPVQNDLSLEDVHRFGFTKMFDTFISTGNDEVGVNRNEMSRAMMSLWRSDAVVIAKGMGNYETISEFRHERPVVHIMRVKCAAVADDTGETEGTYATITGGE